MLTRIEAWDLGHGLVVRIGIVANFCCHQNHSCPSKVAAKWTRYWNGCSTPSARPCRRSSFEANVSFADMLLIFLFRYWSGSLPFPLEGRGFDLIHIFHLVSSDLGCCLPRKTLAFLGRLGSSTRSSRLSLYGLLALGELS